MNTLKNLIIKRTLYGAYQPPVIRVEICRPGGAQMAQRPWGRSLKCVAKQPGSSRTNGMPWDGTSPISTATEIDAPRPVPGPRAVPDTPVWGWDLCRLWEMADNPFFSLSWRQISVQLEEMSDAVSDPEFGSELKLLGNVAYQRHLDQ